MTKWVEPQEIHIEKALASTDKIGDGELLIHCHAGISRSSAIALAIIAKGLGESALKLCFLGLLSHYSNSTHKFTHKLVRYLSDTDPFLPLANHRVFTGSRTTAQ